MPSIPISQAICVWYDVQFDFSTQIFPSVIQLIPHCLHYSWVDPIAAEQLVKSWQLAELVDPVAGIHPHWPSVPNIQLAFSGVKWHAVIATQVIPFVVHNFEAD